MHLKLHSIYSRMYNVEIDGEKNNKQNKIEDGTNIEVKINNDVGTCLRAWPVSVCQCDWTAMIVRCVCSRMVERGRSPKPDRQTLMGSYAFCIYSVLCEFVSESIATAARKWSINVITI